MKVRMLLFSLIAFAAWVSAPAVAQGNSPSSRLLALEKTWNTAYKRGDVAAMNSLLADDFIITIEDGRTFSKSGYIALNGNSTVQVEVSEMSDVKVRMHGATTCVVTGAYHEKGRANGKPYEYHDRFTDVWLNTGSKWQLIASQYSIPSHE
jgi:ketosteroid isomerase-like protein